MYKITFQIEGATPVIMEANKGDNLLELARRGAHVVLCYAGNTEAAQSTVAACEALGVRALAIQASQPALSLTPVSEEDGGRELDIPVESPEEELADRISLQEVLAGLPPEDRTLIFLRFFSGKTQSETAKVLGTTQVQISRRERKILKHMRGQLLTE